MCVCKGQVGLDEHLGEIGARARTGKLDNGQKIEPKSQVSGGMVCPRGSLIYVIHPLNNAL